MTTLVLGSLEVQLLDLRDILAYAPCTFYELSISGFLESNDDLCAAAREPLVC